MKILSSISVLLLLSVAHLHAQHYEYPYAKQSWQTLSLKGKVKTMKTYSYTIMDGEKHDIYGYTYSFNPDGLLTEKDQTDGILQGDKAVFHFDAGARLTLVENFNAYSKDTAAEKYTFQYGKNNSPDVIKYYMHGYNWDFMTGYKFTYDTKGNCLSKEESDKKGNVTENRIYKYDSKDRLLCETIYNGSDYYATYSFAYDAGGNKIEQESKYASGGLFLSAWTYDVKGNPVQLSATDKKENKTEITTYTYEFDSTGNWTKRTARQNNTVTEVITRQFEYF